MPKKVTIPDQGKKKGKILKISYQAIANEDDIIDFLMCTAEDITSSELLLKSSNQDQENYYILREVIEIKEKVFLSNSLELCLDKSFKILDDFISPMSDTYEKSHFLDHFKFYLESIQNMFTISQIIRNQTELYLTRLNQIKEYMEINKDFNIQFEVTNLLCSFLNS